MDRVSQKNIKVDRGTASKIRAVRVAGNMEEETVGMGRKAGNQGCGQMEFNHNPMAAFDSQEAGPKPGQEKGGSKILSTISLKSSRERPAAGKHSPLTKPAGEITSTALSSTPAAAFDW